MAYNSQYMEELIDNSFNWKGFGISLTLICASFGMIFVACSRTSPARSGSAAAGSTSSTPAWESLAASTTLGAPFSAVARTILPLTIAEAVPAQGKFIAADLADMKLYLYQDGTSTATYQILTKGKPGSPYETPGGVYKILTKETDHFNHAEAVHMPYSMEFYGNYFIHGWPYYADGTPVASTYSGGCIRLSTKDAAQVYKFASRGVEVFVFDPGRATTTASIALAALPLPDVSASSYLVADIDSRDVYAERDARIAHPIASVTKLMTALVANETIMFDKKIAISRNDLLATADAAPETFTVGNLLYPLLLQSNDGVADVLASHYGTDAFVRWMNDQALALDMTATAFTDATGASDRDVSTPEDLYRLSAYLADKKSFVWDITRTPEKTIVADDGSAFSFSNSNEFSGRDSFIGGTGGDSQSPQDAMVSLFSVPINGQVRRIAVIVLGSSGYATDTDRLAQWFDRAATAAGQSACVSCALPEHYRKIELAPDQAVLPLSDPL